MQAALREEAKAKLAAAQAQHSEADCAFCRMILRQDNPQRTLDDKWADLRAHMHHKQFRYPLIPKQSSHQPHAYT